MERTEEDWLVKRIVGSDVRDMKLKRRPQMGWMEDVKRLLNERNVCCTRKDDCL